MTADPMETATVLTVGDGFCVRQAVDNIAWIDLGDCGLVVDALEQPHLEAEVLQAVARTLGDKPVRYVLNTHTHYDHVALNGAFQRRWGAEIVNQRTARISPEGRWFEGRRRRVLMFAAPGCHTAEDCCVWVEQERALFVGDIFGWGLIPLAGALNDKAARLLEDTYARLIGFDAEVVVPGHGPVCSTAELERWVEYFRWLRDEVARAVEAGQSDSQIRGRLGPPEDMKDWWRFTQWKHADSLDKVIRAGKARMT